MRESKQNKFSAVTIRRAGTKSSGRVERRKLRTRQALIDATHSLLATRSIDALSVDEIAMRADVAKGTFYNYFADKDALALELATRVRERIESEVANINAGIEDPAVRIARAFACVMRFGLTDRAQARSLMRLFPHATDPATPLNAGVRDDVVNGLARGRIVVPSAEVGVALIVGVGLAGLNRVTDLAPSEAASFARDMGLVLLRGLGIDRRQASRIISAAVASVLETE
jgi:AcrR family transcriptional regulator